MVSNPRDEYALVCGCGAIRKVLDMEPFIKAMGGINFKTCEECGKEMNEIPGKWTYRDEFRGFWPFRKRIARHWTFEEH